MSEISTQFKVATRNTDATWADLTVRPSSFQLSYSLTLFDSVFPPRERLWAFPADAPQVHQVPEENGLALQDVEAVTTEAAVSTRKTS